MRAMHAVGGSALLEQHDEVKEEGYNETKSGDIFVMCTQDGNYAIHLAAMENSVAAVEQLMEWGGAQLLTKENNEVAFLVALIS